MNQGRDANSVSNQFFVGGATMTDDQKTKCHAIIHSHAVAAAAGNAAPIPGLGIAIDMVAMTTMAMALCAMFGGNVKEETAKTLAIAALKNAMLKQPIRTLAKELSKLVPGLGQIVAPSIAVVMIEAAGWVLASELDKTAPYTGRAKPNAGAKPRAKQKPTTKKKPKARQEPIATKRTPASTRAHATRVRPRAA
jgi:uncharacterized protein (DUF697 family)